MSLLVAVTGRNNSKLLDKLTALLPNESIIELDQDANFDSVEFVLAWNPPLDLWKKLPNLKAVSSYGAGVDSLLTQPSLPNVPIARIVDPNLAISMSEYVHHAIGHFKLRFNQYFLNKPSQTWKPCRAKSGNKVGILGLGQLGATVGKNLASYGFEVSGWSRSAKTINGINCYHGQTQLPAMLSELDYLVCLLPLTSDTRGILNQQLFEALPQGAVLINVARGEHLNEADLLNALATEHLAGAALDVFATEPLPEAHPLWQQDNILLTPHISAVTSVDTACGQIAENYLLMKAKQRLLNTVNVDLGY